jgi:hypothetical protein
MTVSEVGFNVVDKNTWCCGSRVRNKSRTKRLRPSENGVQIEGARNKTFI